MKQKTLLPQQVAPVERLALSVASLKSQNDISASRQNCEWCFWDCDTYSSNPARCKYYTCPDC